MIDPRHPGRGLFLGAYLSTRIRGRGVKRLCVETLPVAGGDPPADLRAPGRTVALPLATTPANSDAHDVFTPAELDARLSALAVRAAARLPLSPQAG